MPREATALIQSPVETGEQPDRELLQHRTSRGESQAAGEEDTEDRGVRAGPKGTWAGGAFRTGWGQKEICGRRRGQDWAGPEGTVGRSWEGRVGPE